MASFFHYTVQVSLAMAGIFIRHMESNDAWMGHILWKQGPTGDYTLNVDELFTQPSAVDELKSRCRFSDAVYKMMSDRRSPPTLDSLKRRLQQGQGN